MNRRTWYREDMNIFDFSVINFELSSFDAKKGSKNRDLIKKIDVITD